MLTASLLCAGTGPAYAYKSYLVYAGCSNDVNLDTFKSKLDSKPSTWTSNVLKTNNVQGVEPYHDDLTNYADDTVGARLLVYSGHGCHDGFIPFYKKIGSGSEDFRPVKREVNGVLKFDLLRFDGSWDHSGGQDMGYPYWWPVDYDDDLYSIGDTLKEADWAVGAHWLPGSTTQTESRWNNNVKHVFLLGCSLLNDGSVPTGSNLDPDYYKSTWASAAYGWARTLLGTPSRAHQIAGYWHSAPDTATSSDIINDFFSYHNNGDSIFESWRKANTLGGRYCYWAFLEHYACHNDYLPGWGSSAPPPSTTVNIDYWMSQKYPSKTDILTSSTASPIQTFNNLETKFNVMNIPDNVPTLHEYRLLPAEVNLENLEKEFFATDPRVEKETDSAGVVHMKTQNKRLHIFPTGAILFESGGIADRAVDFTKEAAVERAKNFLTEHGGVPEDACEPEIIEIKRKHCNVIENNFDGEEVMGYTIEFKRKLNGYDIEGFDRIQVTIDAEGVKDFYKLWRPMQATEKTITFMPVQELISKIKETSDLGLPPEVTVNNFVAGYHASNFKSSENVLKPVWILNIDGGLVKLCFDAVTGEIVR